MLHMGLIDACPYAYTSASVYITCIYVLNQPMTGITIVTNGRLCISHQCVPACAHHVYMKYVYV